MSVSMKRIGLESLAEPDERVIRASRSIGLYQTPGDCQQQVSLLPTMVPNTAMLQRHPYRYEQPLPPSQHPPSSQHPSQTLQHSPPPMTPGHSLVSTPLASTSSLSPPPKSATSRKRKKTEDDAPRDRAQAEPRRLRRLHEACARCRGKKIKVRVPVRVRKYMLMLMPPSATPNTQTAAHANQLASNASKKTAIARPCSPAATSSTSSPSLPSVMRYSLGSSPASTPTISTAISRTRVCGGHLRTQMFRR